MNMMYPDEIFFIVFFSFFGLVMLIASISICMHHTNCNLFNRRQQVHVHPEPQIPIQIIIMGQDAVIVEQPRENSVQIIGIRES